MTPPYPWRALIPGATYRVKIRGRVLFPSDKEWPQGEPARTRGIGIRYLPTRIERRIFKGMERRCLDKNDDGIPCFVFSSPLRRGRVPASEVSVPHYDLQLCERDCSLHR